MILPLASVLGKREPITNYRPATSNTGDPESFAFSTVRERWPKIISTAIAELENLTTISKSLSEDDVNAGRQILSSLKSLRVNMKDNTTLEPLPDDGGSDIDAYNAELQNLHGSTWGNSPWLYAECYMYRLVHTFFSSSTRFWQKFDIFHESKSQSLVGSKRGTLELVKRFHGMRRAIADNAVTYQESEKAIFEEMIQISLWGNATDLSLLTTLTMDDLTSRQGKAARENSKTNVVVDDTDKVWTLLSELKQSTSSGLLHFVLDNAGFELLTDLVLVGYLLDSGYAEKIVLHGKRMPWFVSDVNRKDLDDLIQGFIDGSVWPDLDSCDGQDLKEAGAYWQNLLSSGKLTLQTHPFWTSAHSFGRMPDVEPELWKELASADLIIYKGDLNYRKLTYDGCWPKSTPFCEAIGPLAKKHDGRGTRSLVLRTCKADVCVGLAGDLEQKLEKGWTRTGKYAVVSYCDGKL